MSDNWKTERLGNAATLQRGYDLPYRLRKTGPIPIVTSSGIEDMHSKAMVKGPGVVTGRYGTIGEVFFVRGDFWPLNTTLYVRDFHGNDPLFVSYLLRTIDFHSHSGKTGVPGVNRNDLHEIEVSLPPTRAEQEAIAEALSDADALIESVEQLIVKKRHLKQGAMQELLTGKKRLPQFRNEWASVRLGELFTFKNGLNKGKEFFGYGTPIVNYMDVFQNQAIYCSMLAGRVSLSEAELSSFDIRMGDVLFTRTSETVDEVGMASVVLDEPRKTVFSGFLLRARPKNNRLCNEFKRYCFGATYVRHQIISRASYTTRALTNGKILSALTLLMPAAEEQLAIAEILSDMDAQIASLAAKLTKARQLKQGMMQELLNGRVRLV